MMIKHLLSCHWKSRDILIMKIEREREGSKQEERSWELAIDESKGANACSFDSD